jgi:hypothetical protein
MRRRGRLATGAREPRQLLGRALMERVTKEGAQHYVPVAGHIETFDDDGTRRRRELDVESSLVKKGS